MTAAGSPLKASMLRDIERGGTTEGEHAIGDLATRARALGVATPILDSRAFILPRPKSLGRGKLRRRKIAATTPGWIAPPAAPRNLFPTARGVCMNQTSMKSFVGHQITT